MTDRAKVLMVCTGNICRSPAMHYLAQRDWAEAAQVSSAGTHAELGMDATPEIRRAAGAFGLSFPRHRPAQLTADMVEVADLVLVATDAHAAWIEREVGHLPRHVFGLKQAAELSRRTDAPVGDTASDRLRAAAEALYAGQQRDPAPLRSLDDPWGHDQETFDRVMAEIVDSIGNIGEWASLALPSEAVEGSRP